MDTIITTPGLLVNKDNQSLNVPSILNGIGTTILKANLEELIKQRDRYVKLANKEDRDFSNLRNTLTSDFEKYNIKSTTLQYNIAIIKDTLLAANRFNNPTILHLSNLKVKERVYSKKINNCVGEKYIQLRKKLKKELNLLEVDIEKCKKEMDDYNKKVHVEIQIFNV